MVENHIAPVVQVVQRVLLDPVKVSFSLAFHLLNMPHHRQEHLQFQLIAFLAVGIVSTLHHQQRVNVLKDMQGISEVGMWQHDFGQLINHDLDLLAFFGQTEIVELCPEAVVDL
jgi:hypothetical protein